MHHFIQFFLRYWLTDCMPLPAAALFAPAVYPMMRVEEPKKFLGNCMSDVNVMAFATILLSLSTWSSGLTKRTALKILALSGGDFRKCSFLLVTTSALCSLWYPDTAVMMFMMDVVDKLLDELKSSISLGSLGDERMERMKELEAEETEQVMKYCLSNLSSLYYINLFISWFS